MQTHDILNVIVLLAGATTAFLTSHQTIRYKRYGFGIGLASAPIWLYLMYSTQNYGVFTLSLWYGFTHIRGLINHPLEEE